MNLSAQETVHALIPAADEPLQEAGREPRSAYIHQRKRRFRLSYFAAIASAATLAACGGASQNETTGSNPKSNAAVRQTGPDNVNTIRSTRSISVTNGRPGKRASKPKPKPAEAECNVLVLSIELGRERGAAGSIYAPLRFTNIGKAACWFYGYPGVSAWSGQHQIGEPAARDRSVSPEKVSLHPGETAHARLRITEAANHPHKVCKPEEAEGLMVFPPGSYGAKVAADRFTACAGNVALLHVRPVVK